MIEAMRQKNRFSSGDYTGYKNYLKVEMRGRGQGEDRDLYKLESNLSKFFIFNSTRFLKSNLRILRRNRSEFGVMYSTLMRGMVGGLMEKPIEIGDLLELRKRLLPYKTFVGQIDALLESAPYSFDTSSLKTRYMWNDIAIGFRNDFERDQFLEGKAPQDGGYDADIATFILKVENKKKRLLSLIKSKPTKIVCISKKVEKLLETLDRLKVVLNENLVESAYVEKMINDTEELKAYYLNIAEFKRCLKWDDSIDGFKVPLSFKEVEPQILEVRDDLSYVSRKCLRGALSKYLEKSLQPTKPAIKVPFIPVLFDVARDYISYPAEDKNMEDLFKKLHMFK